MCGVGCACLLGSFDWLQGRNQAKASQDRAEVGRYLLKVLWDLDNQ
jgi:hypothetical protein